MVETPDKIPLPGLASNGRVSRRRQDHLGLLKRRQLMNVAQELQEAHLPRQVGFAEPPQYPHIGLQQRKEALRSILMHVPARVFVAAQEHNGVCAQTSPRLSSHSLRISLPSRSH